MKLYIWNLEYKVLLAFADSEEEARELILKQSKQNRDYKDRVYKAFDDQYIERYRIHSQSKKLYGELWNYTSLEREECETYVRSNITDIEVRGEDREDSEYADIYKLKNNSPSIILDLDMKLAYLYSHLNE
jgi:hypothetical protein